jgi:hypothetical protein
MRYCWHFSTFGVQIFLSAFVLADKYFFVNPQCDIAARYGLLRDFPKPEINSPANDKYFSDNLIIL